MMLGGLLRKTTPNQTHGRKHASLTRRDIFSETTLDHGLHSVVDKKEPADEKDLAKQQRLIQSMAHLALLAGGREHQYS